MEIPPAEDEDENAGPLGGEMDGMADFNTPAPQMGSDMSMEDPNMMGGDGQDMDMGGDPNAMGDDQMMGGDQGMDMGGSPEDDELTNVINNLSIEDKAAVLKYAKSMTDDDSSEGGAAEGLDQLPESRGFFGRIIDEAINSIKGKKETGMKRPDKSLSRTYRGKKDNPFISPY